MVRLLHARANRFLPDQAGLWYTGARFNADLSQGAIMQRVEHVYEVAEDIIQVQLPLPFALKSVNCYLLRGNNGWTILDSGLNMPAGQAAWQAAFARLNINPGDIQQIILTHFHPDHYGMAGWLQHLCQEHATGHTPEVRMSPREAELARRVWGFAGGEPEPTVLFFRACGVPEPLTQAMARGIAHLRAMTHPHPTLHTLATDTTLPIGRRSFVLLHCPGHSDDQIILYDPADRLVLCGDHVLATISPHIGTWPESEPDPLGRYLASLGTLATLDVRLALPGHGPLIDNWQRRLSELAQHHTERLEVMRTLARDGATAYEVCTGVFDVNRLSPHEMRFAIAETLSHLELLVQQGLLHRDSQATPPRYIGTG